MAEDPYRVLGLAPTATQQQVSEAYRALAQIYHPDRYAEAPSRVKEEALRRMQAVNAAYAALRDPSARTRLPSPPTTRPEPRDAGPMTAVLYVDGSPRYHDASVAPLGLDVTADPVAQSTHGSRCAVLDEELGEWFSRQTRNASMADKLMYAAWDETQRALYTATVGCSQVLLSSVEAFATACADCRRLSDGGAPG